MRHVELPLQQATAAAVAPFGMLVARAATRAEQSNFYTGHIQMSRPAEFRCDHPVEIALATLNRRPGEVRYLERHFAHTQTFIPLGGKPFVMVLAPACEGELPPIESARAFRFDGSQGFALNLGTWHEFPFAIQDDTQIVVLMSSQTGYDLLSKDPDTQEASGPDLDKKDFLRRSGVTFTVDLDASVV